MDFFRHRPLVLDYPARRFVVLGEDERLPDDLERRCTFVPAAERNGKLYFPVEIDGVLQTEYFFDTGASAFPLVTSLIEWRRLTQRVGNESSNHRVSVSSWATTITLVGAPMTGTLKIGPLAARGAMVYFTTDADLSRFDVWPNTKGLLGNELFASKYVIVVDLPHRRFGLAVSHSALPNIGLQ